MVVELCKSFAQHPKCTKVLFWCNILPIIVLQICTMKLGKTFTHVTAMFPFYS